MEYLIVDFSKATETELKNGDGKNVSCFRVGEKELFNIMQQAKDNGFLPNIAVYKIGDCVLDWS